MAIYSSLRALCGLLLKIAAFSGGDHRPSAFAKAPAFARDLAAIYGVETKILNKAVSRNRKKFPPDFAFRITAHEFTDLRFQNGTSNEGRGE